MNRLAILLLLNLSLTAAGQDNPVEGWQKKLEAFYSSAPPVVVHLQFNQPQYAPGDTAFFRAAFLTAEEMLPIKGPQILMVDLVEPRGEVKLHQEFRVKDGWGGSQVVLPKDIEPGVYRIKAYCDWMKNFDHSLFFTGQLEVAGKNTFDSITSLPVLDCFPEGGKLIAGLKNRVVVRGLPDAGKGEVTDNQGKVVADFVIGRNGYGFFYLTPLPDQEYSVHVGQMAGEIPKPETEGIAMLLTANTDKNNLHRVLLQAPPSALRTEKLYAVVSGHGSIYYSAEIQFKDLEYLAVNVPTTDLPAGISTISILRSNGEALCSRLVYTRKEHGVFPRITLSKLEVVTREKVSLKLAVSDGAGKPVMSRVSVSVYNEDLFPGYAALPAIDDYLWGSCNAEPGLPSLESPDADLYLITRTWPWYTWQQVLRAQEKPKHFFEGYQKLTGKLTAPVSDFDIGTKSKMTFYLESTGDMYEFETDDRGVFSGSLLFDFYDQEEIFYRVERNGRKLFKTSITLDDNRMTYPLVAPGLSTSRINPYFQYAEQRNLIGSSYSFFDRMNAELVSRKESANALMEDELWGAEFEIDLDDFTIFPTMQETVHEIIPWLQNRKRDGKDVLRMYLPDLKTNGEESPTFLIDGILTDDADYFLSLKPVNVDKIKLVTKGEKLSKLGALGKNGLVLVETKIPGNAARVSRNNSTFMAHGLTRPIPFSAQRSWQMKTSRVPRMQSCLYWNPDLRTNARGETEFTIQATDDTGRFRVVVEGLTNDGRPFRTEVTFRVNFGRVTH